MSFKSLVTVERLNEIISDVVSFSRERWMKEPTAGIYVCNDIDLIRSMIFSEYVNTHDVEFSSSNFVTNQDGDVEFSSNNYDFDFDLL